ncbi:MAG: primosomal protein N' [Myxococcota bacterium]|jgi:primosomal protein N' (replication factor Y)|nr:primosomal protein N' [Myxococcota bacterium]
MTESLFAAPSAGVARVALPVPIDSLFDYRVAAEQRERALAGHRVQVVFGGRPLTGVICELLAEAPADAPETLSTLESVIDDEPVLSAAMLRMLREAAADILCPVGLAITAALPRGSAPRAVRELAMSEKGRRALETGAVRGVALAVLEKLRDGPATPAAISRAVPPAQTLLVTLERDGLLTRVVGERGPTAKARHERVARVAEGTDVEAVCESALSRAPKQAEFLRRVAAAGAIPVARLREDDPRAAEHLRNLEKRGFVRFDSRAAPRDVLGPPVPRDQPHDLTDDQARSLASIAAKIRAAEHQTFLLHGVTGSGKTEVYLRAVREVLDAGRQALLLVPEITLTHQIVARLRARFGDELAVLHSGLNQSERLEQWQRLRAGDTPIAVGARSALFAPLDNLGLIVIDEEHDSAYKNDEGFRYTAHDLARRRAQAAGCPVVLGSATPSLETRYAADSGALERLVLAERIGTLGLPSVEIVDLAREREVTARGQHSALTVTLRRALHETLEAGGQSILFLNRRGFSTQIYCFECGFAERCPHCEVALVFHAAASRLRCHYCDYNKAPPKKCGGCGHPGSALLGTGTERLEEEVRTAFPEARIARLDRDTTSRRGATAEILAGVSSGSTDILIGTQMVAKGHDYPGVQLVGVIAADMGLHMPDFRAAERSFQLLTQVAGRAGRADRPGRVILQSFVPEHYAIAPVATHDYEAFYATELEFRRALSYPPFGRVTQLIVSGEDEGQTLAAARKLASAVGAKPAQPLDRDATMRIEDRAPAYEVLGPAPAPLARLRGRYRYQILIKGSDRERVMAASRHLAQALARLPRALRGSLDVNPVSML